MLPNIGMQDQMLERASRVTGFHNLRLFAYDPGVPGERRSSAHVLARNNRQAGFFVGDRFYPTTARSRRVARARRMRSRSLVM